MIVQQRAVASDAAGDPLEAASLLNVSIRRERSVNGGWQPDGRRALPAAASLAVSRCHPEPAVPVDPAGDSGPTSGLEKPEELFDYWHGHLNGRRFPAWSEFEPGEVLRRWPNTVLLACDKERRGPRLSAAFVEALRAAKRKDAEQLRPSVDYSPQLTEWLLALGREVSRLGKPIRDSELLPGLKGRVPYRVVALPLGETPFAVDHVLCHVMRD